MRGGKERRDGEGRLTRALLQIERLSVQLLAVPGTAAADTLHKEREKLQKSNTGNVLRTEPVPIP